MITMVTEKSQKIPKNPNEYKCEKCNYNTLSKKDFNKHLGTAKHKMITNDNEMITENPKKSQKNAKIYHCECGLGYKYKSGLSRHRSGCSVANAPVTEESQEIKKVEAEPISESSLITSLIENQNKIMETFVESNKMQSKILEKVSDNIGNNITNNISNNVNYNVNVFLNEQCKDAMNLLDFVNNIQCQLEDLEYMGKEGYVEGISKVLIDSLSDMEVTNRPIHCTDSKRKSLYIKNNNEWHKDNNNVEMKKAITHVAHKNRCNIKSWQEKYPEHHSKNGINGKQQQYLKMVNEAFNLDDDGKDANKIIKNIGDVVSLDKNIIKDEIS
jgi:transcriptional regulator of heat shock response